MEQPRARPGQPYGSLLEIASALSSSRSMNLGALASRRRGDESDMESLSLNRWKPRQVLEMRQSSGALALMRAARKRQRTGFESVGVRAA